MERHFYKKIFKKLKVKNFKVYFFTLEAPELLLDLNKHPENIFFRILIDNNIENIKFWRTTDKKEIDFIVKEKYAFEIKLNLKYSNFKKYQKFKEKYPDISLNYVTYQSENYLDVFDFLA